MTPLTPSPSHPGPHVCMVGPRYLRLGTRVPASPALIGGALPQTYLLKLARSGEDGEKVFLVLESGTRFHTTQVWRVRLHHKMTSTDHPRRKEQHDRI